MGVLSSTTGVDGTADLLRRLSTILLANYHARNRTITRCSSSSSVRALTAWDFDPVRRNLQFYLLHPGGDFGTTSMTKDLLSEALKIRMEVFS